MGVNKQLHSNIEAVKVMIGRIMMSLNKEHLINACSKFRSRIEEIIERNWDLFEQFIKIKLCSWFYIYTNKYIIEIYDFLICFYFVYFLPIYPAHPVVYIYTTGQKFPDTTKF